MTNRFKILINAKHPVDTERWGCIDEVFNAHEDPNGNWYIVGKWGCSKLYKSLDSAVRGMAYEHGCNEVKWREAI